MERVLIWLCVVLLALPLIAGTATASDDDGKKKKEEGKPQTLCPVDGKEMSRKFIVDYNDKRV